MIRRRLVKIVISAVCAACAVFAACSMSVMAQAPGSDRNATDAPASTKAAPSQRTKISDQVKSQLIQHLKITYARYGDRTLALDLYRPKNTRKKLPGIVCIHGGGWAKGNRKHHANLAMALAARGYVAATISYRLSGEAPYPAAIHDCKAAVRWMRANAKTYGLDPKRIGAIGLSAGGHLTALLATSAGVEILEGKGGNAGVSSAVQAAVPMGAQTDLLSARIRDISATADRGAIWRQFLGGPQTERTTNYKLASPLHHLDEKDPPLAFITGENDDPSTRAQTIRSAMKKLDIDSSLKVIPGAPHPFLNRQAWFDQCIDAAVAFFDKKLKGTK